MGDPRRRAQVLTSSSSSSSSAQEPVGVWFVGHGSFNIKTDAHCPTYTIPVWLKGGVKFWCHDKETLKAVISGMIIDAPKLASLPGLIQAAWAEKYPNRNFDHLPSTYLPSKTIQMYRLTNADDNAMTPTIVEHPNVITVSSEGKWPDRSRTIQQLIEDNKDLICRSGYVVNWLACRTHKNR